MTWRHIKFVARWLIGLWLVWLCAKGLIAAMQKESMGAAGTALFAFAKGIAGVLLLAPDLARLAARPFHRFIDSIYLPSHEAAKPPLDYRLADHYRKSRLFDDAVAEYAKIVRYYPREVVAHARLYQILRDEIHDERAARRARHRAERALRQDHALEEFEALTS